MQARTILIVDDCCAVRDALARYFARCGYSVDLAADGREALALVGNSSYSALISDCSMPGMGGIDLHRAVARAQPQLARRTVFMSGEYPTLYQRDYFALNMCRFFLKPMQLPLLLHTVTELTNGC